MAGSSSKDKRRAKISHKMSQHHHHHQKPSSSCHYICVLFMLVVGLLWFGFIRFDVVLLLCTIFVLLAMSCWALGRNKTKTKTNSTYRNENSNVVVQVSAEEFYKMVNHELFDKAPQMDAILRHMIRGTVRSWTLRFGRLPTLLAKSLVWLQVNKGYNGKIGDALDFGSYDPLECLEEVPLDPSSGIRCAEIFLFFAVDGDVPGNDLSSREAVIAFLNALNSKDGTCKIHAFTVVAGSVVATKEKLLELRGKHLTA